MQKNKKIALVIPSLALGGAVRVITELANYFVTKSDVEVHLIVLVKSKVFFQISNYVKLHEPKFNYKTHYRPIFTLKILIYLRNTLKLIQPITCLSFGGRYNSFVLLAAYGLGIKVFISDRSQPSISYGRIINFLNSKIYKSATGIIAQTSNAKEFAYKQTGHHNIKVIPNPIRALRQSNTEKQNIILNVGRFIPSKQQKLLIEIFSRVHAPDWKLQFLGDGECFQEAIYIAKHLGISDRVLFEGMKKDIDTYYLSAKIFAFVSISEGFPNALAEAASYGLACISFDCDAGPRDLIDDGETGFLIPLDNVYLYTKKLQELIENENLRVKFGKQAKMKMENLNITKIGNEYLKFILS